MNIYDYEIPSEGELFETLYRNSRSTIVRIVSSETPEEKLYIQEEDEWVCLLEGEALLEIDGKKVKTVRVNEERCMFCGNCYTMCPAMPLADEEGDGIAILVGGKISNRISAPKFSKLVVPYIENEPPRWPKVVQTVKKILETYANDARKYERLGEWAERITWERFFEKCDIPFTDKSIDDYRLAYDTYHTTTQFKWSVHTDNL